MTHFHIKASAAEHRLCRVKENPDLSRPTERQQVIGDTAQKLKELTGASRLDYKKESLWVVDSFKTMHPAAKLALGAGVVYLFASFRGIRNAVIASVTGMLLYRLLTKKNPVDGVANILMALQRGVTGDPKAELMKNLQKQAEDTVKFLEPHDYEGIKEETIGLGLLSQVPLRDLAQSFDVRATDQANWELNVAAGSLVDKRIKEALSRENFFGNYRDFFEARYHQIQVNEAMAYYFYKYAIYQDKKKYEQRARDEVDRPMQVATLKNYRDLRDKPREVFEEIARAGREMALRNGQTLGDVMLEMNKPLVPPQEATMQERRKTPADSGAAPPEKPGQVPDRAEPKAAGGKASEQRTPPAASTVPDTYEPPEAPKRRAPAAAAPGAQAQKPDAAQPPRGIGAVPAGENPQRAPGQAPQGGQPPVAPKK